MSQEAGLDAGAQELLQAVYILMKQRGDWPTFTAVDLSVDRELGIEDAQAALLAVPDTLLFRPWQSHGFSSNDPVRLTLRGVATCRDGAEDLQLLARFVAWTVDLERNDTGPAETSLIASSEAFAVHEGLPIVAPDRSDDQSTTVSTVASNEDSTSSTPQQPPTHRRGKSP